MRSHTSQSFSSAFPTNGWIRIKEFSASRLQHQIEFTIARVEFANSKGFAENRWCEPYDFAILQQLKDEATREKMRLMLSRN